MSKRGSVPSADWRKYKGFRLKSDATEAKKHFMKKGWKVRVIYYPLYQGTTEAINYIVYIKG